MWKEEGMAEEEGREEERKRVKGRRRSDVMEEEMWKKRGGEKGSVGRKSK